MYWREFIIESYRRRPSQPGIAFRPEFPPSATMTAMCAVERELNAEFPDSLRAFLLESNGVSEMMAIDGGDWFVSMDLVWSVEAIAQQNREHRLNSSRSGSPRSFTDLLLFAHAGADGILFAFPAEQGVCQPRVVVWHPISKELSEFAPSFEAFLRGWIAGSLTV